MNPIRPEQVRPHDVTDKRCRGSFAGNAHRAHEWFNLTTDEAFWCDGGTVLTDLAKQQARDAA